MTPRVAIIGAGLSGLACARRLAEARVETVVFEKSRSFGGRCATRLWEGHVVDHGAQFFTMRDPEFEAEMRRRCGEALRMIGAPVVDRAGQTVGEGERRWYHLNGNNRIGRALAEGLELRRETPVETIASRGEGWQVGEERFDFVVASAPWPQTARLLDLPDSGRYAPCLTAFYAYEGKPVGLAAGRYAISDREGDLMWSACENGKEGRIKGDSTVFVAQASPEFSRRWLEEEPAEWLPVLQELLENSWLLPREKRAAHFAHRWRFAKTLEAPVIPPLPVGIFVTGDSVVESRIEDVWRHGDATARRIVDQVGR